MSILDARSCRDVVPKGPGGSEGSKGSKGSGAAGAAGRLGPPDREVPWTAPPAPSPERCPSPSSSRCAALPEMLLGCLGCLGFLGRAPGLFFGRTPGAAFPTGLCAHLPTSWVTATISTHTASLASLPVAACLRLSPPAAANRRLPPPIAACRRQSPPAAAVRMAAADGRPSVPAPPSPVSDLRLPVSFAVGRESARDRRPEPHLPISPRSPSLQVLCPLSSDQGPGTAMSGCSPPRTARATL